MIPNDSGPSLEQKQKMLASTAKCKPPKPEAPAGRPIIVLAPDNGPSVPIPAKAMPKRTPRDSACDNIWDPKFGIPALERDPEEYPELTRSLYRAKRHRVGSKSWQAMPFENGLAAKKGNTDKAFYVRTLGAGQGRTNPLYSAPPFDGETIVSHLPTGTLMGPVGDVVHVPSGISNGRWHPQYVTAAVPNLLREQPENHSIKIRKA